MRQQILDDINLVIQRNYGGTNPQFLSEQVPKLNEKFEDLFKSDREKEDIEIMKLNQEQVIILKGLLSMLKDRAEMHNHKSAKELAKLIKLIEPETSLTRDQKTSLSWYIEMADDMTDKLKDGIGALKNVARESKPKEIEAN